MGGTLQEFKIEDCNNLPAGFRFCPTDGEIIHHYLLPKVMDDNFVAVAIGEVDLNSCEPWDLPKKAKMVGESESYFYCLKDRKYPTGTKTNRATEAGFWKATGKDKNIFRGKGVLVGLKKTLVFHRGRAPTGQKTNWIMHEYRLAGKSWNLPKSAKFEWVVCRIFNRKPTKERKTQQDASSTPTKAHGNGYVTLDSLSSQVGYPGNMDTNGNCSFKTHQYPSFLNPQSSMQVESFLDQKMDGEIISAPPLVAQCRTGQFETNRTSAMEFHGGQQSHDQFTLGEFLDLDYMWTC